MIRLRPLHRALMVAFTAPAVSAFAAEPAEAPAKPVQVAQATTAPVAQAATVPVAQAAAPSQKIEVSAQREQYRGDVPLEELPQAVQVITGELLQQIGAVKMNDALDIATGVARQNSFGGLWDGFAIRGFAGDINTPSGYLVNGFNGARGFGGLRDMSSVDKIEILKGPGSALFGRGEPGGTVAITTRKPEFTTQASGTVAYGSYDFKRVEGDFTTPLSNNVAIRINGAYEDADSYRDTVHTKRQALSPSILAKLGAGTTLRYEIEYSKQELPFDRGIMASPTGQLGILPVTRYLGEPGDGPTTAEVKGHQVELQHGLGAGWTLLAGGSYRSSELDGIGQNPEFAAGRNQFFTDGRTLSRQRRFTNYESKDVVGRAEISGNFLTGPVKHHLLAGADFEDFKLDRLQTRYRPPVYNGTQSLAVMNAVDIFNPVYGNAPAANQNVFNDTEKDKSHGFYITDQMDLTQAWKLRLGTRYDKFKQTIDNRLATLQPPEQNLSATSPQAGLTFKVNEDLSFYTMYAKGFRPNTGFDVNRNPFAPEETKSYEVGMKFDNTQNLQATVAVFKMKKTNVLTADPVNAGQSIAIGGAESKGIEVDLQAKLPGAVTVMLSYAYTDAYSTSEVRDFDFGRLVAKGDPLINIPKHNGNLLLLKDFDFSGNKLTAGLGVKYVSNRLGETGTTFFLPSYTLVRALATYNVTKKWSITGEVTNLTDKVYYPQSFAALWVYPGAPRQYQLRTSYRF